MIYSPEVNLRHLIEIVERQPEHTVDLRFYQHDCGTVFCTLGHAACDPFFQAQGLRFEERTMEGKKRVHLTVNGSGAFGHIDPHIRTLFGPHASRLFNIAGSGLEAWEDGFPFEHAGGKVVNRSTQEVVSDKELALARLRWQLTKVINAEGV